MSIAKHLHITDLYLMRVYGCDENFTSTFFRIDTNSEIFGLFGPIRESEILFDLNVIKREIVGKSPMYTEEIWHILIKSARHSHCGHFFATLSAIDCALWDIKGKVLNAPLSFLIGGHSRKNVKCYASMLGNRYTKCDVVDIAQNVKDMHFFAQKWPLVQCENSQGLRDNLELVKLLKKSLGSQYPIMLDAYCAMEYPHAKEFFRNVEDLNIYWIEEPFNTYKLNAWKFLRDNFSIPLACGENLYSHFEVFQFLNHVQVDYLQPEVAWCGGITGMLKIIFLGQLWNIPICPHGISLQVSSQIAGAFPETVIPIMEYHFKLSPIRQHFFKHQLDGKGGVIDILNLPGLGIDIDENKVKKIEKIGVDYEAYNLLKI